MAAYLTYDETYDEDEDEDDDDDDGIVPTGLVCTECENGIEAAEEIFLLRIVRPFFMDGQLVHVDILEADGGFKYEPAFFEFECWEEVQEDVQQIQEDVPPMLDTSGLLTCDICKSDVLTGESVGLLEFGEIHWSARAPNHRSTYAFVALSEGKHICTACLNHIDNNRSSPIWPDDIEPLQNLQICAEGISQRCWRYGTCTCIKRST